MAMRNIDVTCEDGHEIEVFLEVGADGYPVLEPCEKCGKSTSRLWRPRSAGDIAPWTDVDGWDPMTGETVRVTCEADRQALEQRMRQLKGCEHMVAVTQSPAEQRRAFEEAQHRRYEAVQRLGMMIKGVNC